MRKSITKTTVALVMAISLLSTQIILPLQAHAGNDILNYDNPNQSGNNPYKVSLSGILNAGLLTQVVGCTGIVNKVAKVSSDFISKLSARILGKSKLKFAENAAKITSVPSVDSTVANQANTDASTIQQNQNLDSFRIECIDGIAIQLAKNQLTSMTKYTMNWINSGFNGNPLYVMDVDSFMNSIDDQILQKEVNLFKDPKASGNYIYGRSFAMNQINEKQSQDNFQASMQQDLTDYLTPGSTPQSFATDFSQGGWDGWLALTQHSQNNPLGFTIGETQHLANLQNQQKQNTQNLLIEGQGYLPQQKCVQWQRIDSSGNGLYNFNGAPITTDTTPPVINGKVQGICLKNQTVTPGSTIKAKIDTYVNTPERQLELVKTMNDALNSLFAALLNKFEGQGLASLSSKVNNYTGTTDGGLGVNQVFDTNGNSLTPNGVVTANSGSSTGDGYFDLTKDLGNTYTISASGALTINKKGVLQIQHDYLNDVNQSKTITANVLPALGKLDYCIPGPNPNWQVNANDAISAYLDNTNSGTTASIDPATLNKDITDYTTEVNNTYGTSSAMQDPSAGNTKYLEMAQSGLALTADIGTDANTIASAQDDYNTAISDSNSNISKLNAIRDKVNAIIVAAQERRAKKRAQAGLPAIKSICLSTEKVTYLDNGILK